MSKYVIQQVRSKLYVGELTSSGTNSRIAREVDTAISFTSVAAANKHITFCIKNDAGITSKQSVVVVKV